MNFSTTQILAEESAVDPGIFPESHRDPLYLFFIGDSKPEITGPGFYCDSYICARTKLLRLLEMNSSLPAALIISLDFRENDLVSFIIWLKSQPELTFIPVVYNKEYLTLKQREILYNATLVDDIIDISDNKNLFGKVSFLNKVYHYKKSFLTTNKDLSIKPTSWFYKAGTRINKFFKRTFDIVVSSLLIILLLPVFILIAIAIRVESKGPVMYTALRAGRGFKVFRFFKFRTMVKDADKRLAEIKDLNQYNQSESKAVFVKIKDDPRITKIGTFLRNTSLDELPQLFNVLIGDMSIVGNRPLPLYEANTLTTNEWAERFMAPAGITGLWQVKKRGMSDMSAEERISLDIHYARNNNLIDDFKIMAVTPKALFQKTNV